jgi:cohesin complex subunit SA-1/2
MAARDAEVSVRAATIDLLDLIRDAGLLEPDDIDTVGRLIFDIEPRVRKAAGRFFVASVQDVYEATIEGMDEELGEVFADEDEDDFESPKRSWIKYKCLADTLQTYDGQESDVAHEQGATALRTVFAGGQLDSRYALAAEAIYPHFKELDQWESLAGYLLYDHSQIPDQPDDEDSATSVSCLYKLSEGQEAILLQVLGCAVKLHIQAVSRSDTDKRGRKTKQLVERMEERQETTANNLSQIIPQLLNKFGAVPETASAVLRLEHLVDLNLIQDLQKDAAAYSDLISNINKQFLTHSDQTVLAEATVAFLHAQTSDELKEAMESKVQELWDDTTDTLRTLAASKQLDGSQSLSTTVLTTLMNTVMRLSNLVSISDCTSTLETIPKATSKRQKREPDPPVDILLSLAGRGLREDDADEEISALEKEIVTGSFKTLLVYFMWKIQAIKATLSSSSKGTLNDEFFDELSHRRDSFVSTLSAIMQQRSGIDDIRLSATTTLLDLQAAFGTLRNAGIAEKGNAQALDENVVFRAQGLPQEILPETRSWISRIHDAAERYFARKSGRKLEPGADDEPMDSESEIGISSDEDEDSAAAGADNDSLESRRTRAMLLAEQKLCQLTGKIVLAIVARVLGATGPDAGKLRQKLLKNKTRLGPNYKEVLAYLEERKTTTPGAGVKQPRSRANGATAAKKGSKSKSSELVNDDDDEDNESEIHQEEDDDEDLQARGLVEERDGGVDAETPRTPQTPAEDDIMGD